MLTARPREPFVIAKTRLRKYEPPYNITLDPAQEWTARRRGGNWYLTNKQTGEKIRLTDATFHRRFTLYTNANFRGAFRIAAFGLVAAVIISAFIPGKDPTPAETKPAENITHTASVDAYAPKLTTDNPVLITLDEAVEPKQEPVSEWTSIGVFELTAYCPCEKCCGYWATVRPTDSNGNPIVYTSTGDIAQAGTTIAVDPGVIPYGTEVQIDGHTFIAQDTGGAIRGNRIDVYFDDHQEALEFGRQSAEVFVKVTR